MFCITFSRHDEEGGGRLFSDPRSQSVGLTDSLDAVGVGPAERCPFRACRVEKYWQSSVAEQPRGGFVTSRFSLGSAEVVDKISSRDEVECTEGS